MALAFVELKHHHAMCVTQSRGDGTHAAMVVFERLRDHGKTSLDARKFNLPGRYTDERTAIDAAIDFAEATDEAGGTGL